jgi:uncharacterized protein (TIGR01777 family)
MAKNSPNSSSSMQILVTGGTGFIGRTLCRELHNAGHGVTVYTRNLASLPGIFDIPVDGLANLEEWSANRHFDAVINLAGEPIMDRRWSDARKQVLWDTRVSLTERLVARMAQARTKPSVFISGSAIGIYGDQGDALLDESSIGGEGFGHELCAAWETAAVQAESLGVRVCLLRTGLVVGKHGGFLARMLLPFKLGLGGRIGDGRQWMSWIHLRDHVALTLFLLGTAHARGPFNATAPNPVTNMEFTRELADALKRPAFLPVPAWLLKAAAGEMSELLLGSQRVLPRQALASGFQFSYETLAPALRDVLAV